jgi:hypothetical protein
MEPRNLCADIVEIFWDDRAGKPHRAKVLLEDISPAGACIQVECEVPIGAPMALRMREIGLAGTVTYCTLIAGSYFVGLLFWENHGWRPGLSDPQHLLRVPASIGESSTVN